MEKGKAKYLGEAYREKPSPNKIDVFEVDFEEGCTLEDLQKAKEKR